MKGWLMMQYYELSDGYRIPALGLGTYGLSGFEGVRRMVQALGMGYRLLDTAFNYENEGAVGRAVRESGVPRDQITVVSKLPGRAHAYDSAIEFTQESLMRLSLDYIDLYLIHWPNPQEDLYVEAWSALVDMQRAGLIRSIGLSNFLEDHIDRLERETGILPVVNQLELNPYYRQAEESVYHESKGIRIMSWSPFGRDGDQVREPLLVEIGNRYSKSAYQVVVRWQLQLGLITIPKASSWHNQAANLDVFDFELTTDEMVAINSLHHSDGRRPDRHPASHQEF